ncbi:MAG: Cell division protein FtsW [Firmicutes bacterium]|nr:Cell division protein FtsW [Bacillota bacterium]MDI6706319.1 stage V sporulation protein E [Bacillota bacterium]
MNKENTVDFTLLFTVILLVVFGIIMVFSSSSASAYYKIGDSYYFLKRQMLWAVVGFVSMVVLMNFNYENYQRLARYILAGGVLFLLTVFIPGLGITLNGASRWIEIGGYTIQPSEFAKLAVIIYTANCIAKKKEDIRSFTKGVVPFLIVAGIVFGIIMLQPDFSTGVSIVGVVFVMIFIAGANIGHLLGLTLPGIVAVVALVISEEYRLKRWTSFLRPFSDPQRSGYQIIQSLYALGSGGLFGLGLGRSRQKFFYIPLPQNDFIFSIIGEELGFIGATTVVLLFMLLIWRGVRIALHAPDLFGCMLATGIIAMIGMQVIMNIAVVTSSMPVTGITLPFISSGGSSLLLNLSCIGILLNISKKTSINWS